MPSTVTVNGRTLVHRTSDGFSLAAPDLCKLPNGAVVPFVNLAFSRDAAGCAASVYTDGQQVMTRSSYLSTSYGDEPGAAGGVISGRNQGKASFYLYSFDVKIEGEPVPRAFDPMLHNHGSPWNALSPALMQGINPESVKDALCKAFCTCLAVGGRTHCMRTMAADAKYDHGTRYWDPKVPGLYPEVPFHSDGTPIMSDEKSSNQTDAAGDPMRLPCGDRPPIRGSRRPDFVLAKDGKKPLDDPGNIAAIYEIKFPPDDWRPGQKEAYEEIADKHGAPLIVIDPKNCDNCEGQSRPEWSEPVDPDEEKRESEADAKAHDEEEGDYGKEATAPDSPGQDAFDWGVSFGLGVAVYALWRYASSAWSVEQAAEQATGHSIPDLVRIAIDEAPRVLHEASETAEQFLEALEEHAADQVPSLPHTYEPHHEPL